MIPELRRIELPSELCAAAELKFGCRFAHVADLLTFVLRELLCDDAARLDETEQRIVEQRLKDLGYL
jgi:hypothetical protein